MIRLSESGAVRAGPNVPRDLSRHAGAPAGLGVTVSEGSFTSPLPLEDVGKAHGTADGLPSCDDFPYSGKGPSISVSPAARFPLQLELEEPTLLGVVGAMLLDLEELRLLRTGLLPEVCWVMPT